VHCVDNMQIFFCVKPGGTYITINREVVKGYVVQTFSRKSVDELWLRNTFNQVLINLLKRSGNFTYHQV
jgi:hypothetical protein